MIPHFSPESSELSSQQYKVRIIGVSHSLLFRYLEAFSHLSLSRIKII